MPERPDDFERRLAQRLRAYDSSFRSAVAPDPLASGEQPRRWALLGAGGAAAVVVGALLALVVLDDPRPDLAQSSASPTPTASAATPPVSASPTPSGSATASPPAEAPSPVPSASVSPSQTPSGSGAIVRWAPAATFASEGWAEEVLDMTYAAGHFIAVGYREPDGQRGHVGPPIDEARIWISADGRTWEQLDLGPAFEFAHPRSVVTLPDGSAVAYGSIDPEPPSSPSTGAWRSTDGRTWTRLELTLPRDEFLSVVEGGPRGLISVVSILTEDSRTEEIWHSADGATWRVTHRVEGGNGLLPGVYDWQAGPEGFVVTGYRYRFEGEERDDRTFVIASGDGREWFEASSDETPFSVYTHVAPVGGDWIVAANEVADANFTGRATTWFSANGLAWDERTTIEVPEPTSPDEEEIATVVGGLVSTGERVIASGSVVICCHGPWWAAGVWSSFDGRSWERLGFAEGTVVTAAANHEGVVVLAGFDRARPEDDFKARATFWIGERD